MKYLFLFFLSISLSSCQKELSEVVRANTYEEQEVEIVEIEYPEFKGGEEELNNYISTQVGSLAIKENNCGEIVLRFEVSSTGKIGNVNIIRGGEKCILLKQKLISIFQNMPKWKPGLTDNKPDNYNMRYYYQRKVLDFDFEPAIEPTLGHLFQGN